MKKSLDRAISLCCLFLLALACTKDVGLITEVEFEILEEHASEGFVNQGLPTTFTIVPEEILENYEYTISYEILQGKGYFEDVDGNRLEAGKGQPMDSPFTTSLLYMGTEVGEHRVKIVGADNFGISEEIEIMYNLENVPARWEASSELTEIELGKAADISLLFEPVDTALEVTYEARLEFTSGSGTLAPMQDNGYLLAGDYAEIAPGTYPFMFTPSELGPQELVFVLRDSNGQELRETLTFNVVEVIRVISIFLGEDDTIELQLGDEVAPDITFDPPNATDQDFILVSSDPDVVLIDENNVCIAVGLGTAIVTVTSVSNPEATDTVTVTVVEPDRVPVSAITIAQEDPDAQGAVRQLIATVLPADATDASVTWSSSDDTVATIDANGLLTGLMAGTVTITATSVSDPEVVDTIEVNISGVALQDGNDITAFGLPGQNSSEINADTHTITINVAEGTELNTAPSALSISGGATIDPGIGAVRDFNAAQTYTVTAGNGTAQVWTVIVTVSPLVGSASNDITDFSIAGQVAPFTIDATTHTISVTVPNGTTLNVAPQTLVISESATITPAIDQVRDFSGPVEYTVTAENGTEQVWTVNTTVLPITGTGANDITGFALPGQSGQAVIDNAANTIMVTVPDGTSLNVAPITLEISPNATVAPAIGIVQDFSAAVIYTVTADDGASREWTVNTTVSANQAPVAVDDAIGVEVGETRIINVLVNDSDVDTPNSELRVIAIGTLAPAGFGSAQIFNDRSIEFISNGPTTEVEIVTFTYTIDDGNPGNVSTATVTVDLTFNEVLVTGISLNPTELTLDINESAQLVATVAPGNVTNSNIDWSSSDDTIATVNALGEVTGRSEGTATITASSNDASNVATTAAISVRSANIPLTGLTVSPETVSMIEGDFEQLSVGFEPVNASNQDVTWSSSDDTKATVNTSGRVSAIKEGEVTITVTSNENGTILASALITIIAEQVAVESITVTPTDFVLNIGQTQLMSTQIEPTNASNKTLLWSSSNAAATVGNETGLVEAVSPFNLVTITAFAQDGSGIIGQATLRVNGPPDTVDAGEDQTIDLPTNTVILNGVAGDTNGSISQISWTKESGGSATINSPTNLNTQITDLEEGNYVFRLTAIDNDGASAFDEVRVQVDGVQNNPPTANDDNFTVDENAPSAEIGFVVTNDTDLDPADDLVVDRVNNVASLVGVVVAGSGTPAGGLLTISGDGRLVFDPNGDFDDLKLGDSRTVTATYRITDGNGGFSDAATVAITVNGIEDPNVDPVANAGPDQSIQLPVSSVTLDGSASSDTPPGSIVAYLWEQTTSSNGATATIANPTFVSTGVSGLQEGSYTFRLTVRDDQGTIVTDVVDVLVNAAANIDPIANAGPDQSIQLPVSSVTLDGSASSDTPPGSIVAYLWEQTTSSNGATATIANPTFVSTGVSGLEEGSYTFRLTVRDDQNAIATDEVVVTVQKAENNPPTAVDDDTSVSAININDVDVLANDFDVDGDDIIISSFTPPGQGTIRFKSGSETLLEYIPPSPQPISAFITDFTYTITDGEFFRTANVSLGVGDEGPPTPTATWNGERIINTTFPAASGTVTIFDGPMRFSVSAFGGSGGSTVFFTIDGQVFDVMAPENQAMGIETPLFAPGTYTYSLEGLFVGTSGNSGSVTAKL